MCQQMSQLGDWDGKNYVFHIRHVPKSEMQNLITHYNIGKRFYMFLRNKVRFYKRGKVVASRKKIK